ncbi:peroxiredoxin family protein [Thermodesulfobacteriota bacterium]
MKKHITILVLLILLGVGVTSSFAKGDERKFIDIIKEAILTPEGESPPSVQKWGTVVDEPCPKISLENVKTNEMTDLNEMIKGKVTVIIFTQTSCGACKNYLQAFVKMRASVPELFIVAINVDVGNRPRIIKYIDYYNFTFPFLHDPEFSTPKLFGFSYTPGIVIIGKNGKVVYLRRGGY